MIDNERDAVSACVCILETDVPRTAAGRQGLERVIRILRAVVAGRYEIIKFRSPDADHFDEVL